MNKFDFCESAKRGYKLDGYNFWFFYSEKGGEYYTMWGTVERLQRFNK